MRRRGAPVAVLRTKTQRELLFWFLHSLGWTAYGLAHHLSGVVFDRPPGYTTVLLIACALGFVVTIPLRYVCRWLWGKPLWFVLTMALAAAYLDALLWRIGANWAYLHYYRNWILESWPAIFVGTLNYTYLIACWVGLYFLVRYYESMHQQREAALRANALAHQAQVAMLRYQLNPHFLFNTLNAVSTLILDNRGPTANAMVTKLAEFLRHTLDQDPNRKVTLDEEIEALDLYLEVEKLRFGAKLQIVLELAPESRRLLLPSLLLQPLVENSIKYAAAAQEQGATIRIATRVHDDVLHIEIADNGPGHVDTARIANGRGVGLRNTKERLEVLYGDRASLNVRNIAPGVSVALTLPAERANEGESAAIPLRKQQPFANARSG